MTIDEQTRLEEWLQQIWAVTLDEDGCKTVDDLTKLVREVNSMAKDALNGEYSGLSEQ